MAMIQLRAGAYPPRAPPLYTCLYETAWIFKQAVVLHVYMEPILEVKDLLTKVK